MLASTKKTLNSSTVATKSSSTKQKESFFAFIFRKIREAFNRVYLFSRKCLWVSSTGTISFIQGLLWSFCHLLLLTSWRCRRNSWKFRAAVHLLICSGGRTPDLLNACSCSLSFIIGYLFHAGFNMKGNGVFDGGFKLWWFWDGIIRIDGVFINKKNSEFEETRLLRSYFLFCFDLNC